MSEHTDTIVSQIDSELERVRDEGTRLMAAKKALKGSGPSVAADEPHMTVRQRRAAGKRKTTTSRTRG